MSRRWLRPTVRTSVALAALTVAGLSALGLAAGCTSLFSFYFGVLTGDALNANQDAGGNSNTANMNDNQTGQDRAALRVEPRALTIGQCAGIAEFRVFLVRLSGEEPIANVAAISATSDRPEIVGPIDATRVQAGAANGDAKITLSYPDPDDSAKTLTVDLPVTVNVPPPALVDLRIEPANLTFSDDDQRQQIRVFGAFDCGPEQELTDAIGVTTFSSTNLPVATVDNNGLVAPVARGRAAIRINSSGVIKEIPVEVTICKPPVVLLDPRAPITNDRNLNVSGKAEANARVEIFGPAANVVATANDTGNFSADILLGINRSNTIFVTAIANDANCNARAAAATFNIVHDNQAPAVFIDFPAPGATIVGDKTDVAGRVSDLLSGYANLRVVVNGVEAAVNRGIGTNGTFFAMDVPLTVGQANTITATASDFAGNSKTDTISIDSEAVDPNAPLMSLLSGNAQTAAFRSPLTEPLAVRVTKRDGTAFANKLVTFHVTRSDARLSDQANLGGINANPGDMMVQVRTDADGVARAFAKVGSDAGMGNARVEATSAGVQGAITFCANTLSGAPNQINIGAGNNQRAEAGGPAPEPLRIRVSDSCNAIVNMPVTYTVTRGGGKLIDPGSSEPRDSITVNTIDTGHAEARFILGPEVGNNLVEVNYAGNPTGPATFVIYGVARRDGPAIFSGLILNNSNEPLGGAIARLLVNGVEVGQATSTDNGQFRIENINVGGKADLFIDADPITTVNNQPIDANTRYPDMHYETFVVPNAENSLAMNVLLPPLDRANDRQYRYDDANPLELTCDGMDGIKLIVQPQTTITLPDGTVYNAGNPGPLTLALNQVHHDDVPMPMPDGVAPPFAWTFQPSGAMFDKPVAIEYPNMSGLPAGAISYFLSFNHETNKFEIIASGQVSEDGSKSVTDRGVGITTAGWGCNCPPYAVTGRCRRCRPSIEEVTEWLVVHDPELERLCQQGKCKQAELMQNKLTVEVMMPEDCEEVPEVEVRLTRSGNQLATGRRAGGSGRSATYEFSPTVGGARGGAKTDANGAIYVEGNLLPDGPGSYQVELWADGRRVDSRSVKIQPILSDLSFTPDVLAATPETVDPYSDMFDIDTSIDARVPDGYGQGEGFGLLFEYDLDDHIDELKIAAKNDTMRGAPGDIAGEEYRIATSDSDLSTSGVINKVVKWEGFINSARVRDGSRTEEANEVFMGGREAELFEGFAVVQSRRGVGPRYVAREGNYLIRVELVRRRDHMQKQFVEVPIEVKYEIE